MLADGRPFEALKTASMLAISTFWKTFRFFEVSAWLVLASSFGFFWPANGEPKKKERSSLKPDETATTVPLLSSVFSNDLPVKTKIVIIIVSKLPTLNSMKNQFNKNYITFHDFFI